jgi:hypothetical protein
MALALLPRPEADLIDRHLDRLGTFRAKNRVKYDYYEAKNKVAALGHSLPAKMRAVKLAVGFSATVIDSLEERLEFEGWHTEDGSDAFGLDKIYRENDLDVESSGAHTDALITGSGFAIVGRGNPADGEPEVLVTVESPNRVTGEWDARLRRLSSALSVDVEDVEDGITEVTLYTPSGNVGARRVGSLWVEAWRDAHGLGRVQVVQLPNKPRGSRQGGRSEITPALRGYTDEAVRTLLGMNVHREFYQAPQRYLLNASEEWFQASDGISGWDAVQGRMLAVPASDDPDDPKPEIGQFAPAPPTPYLEMIRGIASLVSSEGAIPVNYLGFATDNPPSADAIRALEARLIKKAERRQATLGRGWREVAALSLLLRDGAVPDDFYTVTAKWRDPATPTRAAAADAAAKLVDKGILLPDSEVTYDRIGLSPAEKRTLASEKRRAQARARLDQLTAAATARGPGEEQPPASGDTAGVSDGDDG